MKHPIRVAGSHKLIRMIFFKSSPPNVFIGGPVPVSPGFPLKACGNDGLRKSN